MQINICLKLSHAQNSHLGAKNIPYHTAMLARETGSLTHSLCWTPFFGSCGVPWGPTPNLT